MRTEKVLNQGIRSMKRAKKQVKGIRRKVRAWKKLPKKMKKQFLKKLPSPLRRLGKGQKAAGIFYKHRKGLMDAAASILQAVENRL